MHAGQVPRALCVDRHQPRVGVGGAQHRGVERARYADVFDEAARARDEPIAAQTRVSLTDHRAILALW